MNLKIQRNVELLFRLVGIENAQVSDSMELLIDNISVFIELRDNRLLLSMSTNVLHVEMKALLPAAINEWKPELTQGIPVRFCALENALLVSSLLPEDTDAAQWYEMFRYQKRFLEYKLRHFA